MGDPAKPELQVNLQEVIQTQITAAVAQALSKDTEGLVKAIVEVALSKKEDRKDPYGGYSSKTKTVLEWMVEDAIQKAALGAMEAWAKENRQRLIDKINAGLSERGGFILDNLAEKYINAMNQAVRINVTVDK